MSDTSSAIFALFVMATRIFTCKDSRALVEVIINHYAANALRHRFAIVGFANFIGRTMLSSPQLTLITSKPIIIGRTPWYISIDSKWRRRLASSGVVCNTDFL